MSDRLTYTFRHLGLSTSPGYDPTPRVFSEVDKGDSPILTFDLAQESKDAAETFGVASAISSTLELYGDARNYVKAWLIDNTNASVNNILVSIHDEICDKNMGIWQIKPDNVQWCDGGECYLKVTLYSYSDTTICLRSTLISDNHRGWFPDSGYIDPTHIDPISGNHLDQYMHPRFQYCDDIKPQFLQNFLFVLAQSIAIMINTVIWPILAILQVIQWVVDFFGLSWTPYDDFENQMKSIYEQLFENVLSCSDVHPSPYVRNYFINACSKCGLTFESSILNAPGSIYYNLAHMFAPVRHGIDNTSSHDWIPDNKPVYNALTYAFSLKDIFNAKYRVVNDKLIFERKDRFDNALLFDFTGLDVDRLVGFVCFDWNSEKKPAYQSFEYAIDAIDTDGNNARHRFNGIANYGAYNPTTGEGTPLLQGEDAIRITDYGAARFTTDGIEKRKIFQALSQSFGWLDHYLLMDKAETQLAKLLIYEPSSPAGRAETIRVSSNQFSLDPWTQDYIYANFTSGYNIYNYPMMYLPTYPASYPYQYDELYRNFHAIDDPNLATRKNIEWTATLELCCDTLNTLIVNNTIDAGVTARVDNLVKLTNGQIGNITQVVVDYSKFEIRLKGEIKYT